eukprot:GHVQ01002865.1.p1 GENE.GHVQ01002865.1~~GHVQ01002865.1.p1  ORF type:complete len:829 (+),score=181.33 GHVQ01002865.1:316-2802(+)
MLYTCAAYNYGPTSTSASIISPLHSSSDLAHSFCCCFVEVMAESVSSDTTTSLERCPESTGSSNSSSSITNSSVLSELGTALSTSASSSTSCSTSDELRLRVTGNLSSPPPSLSSYPPPCLSYGATDSTESSASASSHSAMESDTLNSTELSSASPTRCLRHESTHPSTADDRLQCSSPFGEDIEDISLSSGNSPHKPPETNHSSSSCSQFSLKTERSESVSSLPLSSDTTVDGSFQTPACYTSQNSTLSLSSCSSVLTKLQTSHDHTTSTCSDTTLVSLTSPCSTSVCSISSSSTSPSTSGSTALCTVSSSSTSLASASISSVSFSTSPASTSPGSTSLCSISSSTSPCSTSSSSTSASGSTHPDSSASSDSLHLTVQASSDPTTQRKTRHSARLRSFHSPGQYSTLFNIPKPRKRQRYFGPASMSAEASFDNHSSMSPNANSLFNGSSDDLKQSTTTVDSLVTCDAAIGVAGSVTQALPCLESDIKTMDDVAEHGSNVSSFSSSPSCSFSAAVSPCCSSTQITNTSIADDTSAAAATGDDRAFPHKRSRISVPQNSQKLSTSESLSSSLSKLIEPVPTNHDSFSLLVSSDKSPSSSPRGRKRAALAEKQDQPTSSSSSSSYRDSLHGIHHQPPPSAELPVLPHYDYSSSYPPPPLSYNYPPSGGGLREDLRNSRHPYGEHSECPSMFSEDYTDCSSSRQEQHPWCYTGYHRDHQSMQQHQHHPFDYGVTPASSTAVYYSSAAQSPHPGGGIQSSGGGGGVMREKYMALPKYLNLAYELSCLLVDGHGTSWRLKRQVRGAIAEALELLSDSNSNDLTRRQEHDSEKF